MRNLYKIRDDLFYVGGSDRKLALFESAFPIPRGVSYNAYLLMDEKTVLFDTVDSSVGELFFENVAYALQGRRLDYVVTHHMEPDHSATLGRLIKTYPEVTVVAGAKAAQMMKNYFSAEFRILTVKEGDRLETGRHTLQFIAAPMVHWPEVMFTYDVTARTLFSADAFGTFGALGGSVFADEVSFERDFLDDARRYYFNIVGKYGAQTQAVLKKAAGLSIDMVCPLHGPVWRKNFGWYLQKYLTWSAYQPEEAGVAVFYGTIYGHTANAAEILACELAVRGVTNVKVYDVSYTDLSELVSEAFRYSHLVFASSTYNNGVFVNMQTFLDDLKAHNFQNRRYALIENGSWAPQAGKLMREEISAWKGMEQIGQTVTLLSSVSEENLFSLKELAAQIADGMQGSSAAAQIADGMQGSSAAAQIADGMQGSSAAAQ